MACRPFTSTMEEMLKARVLQAAIHDDRSFSNMISKLVEIGLRQYWGKIEPTITDAAQFLEVNRKSKSNDV